MTFEEWWTENERDLYETGTKDIAELAWFAATQAEREACAVACETEGRSWRADFRLCAAVIRARSTKP